MTFELFAFLLLGMPSLAVWVPCLLVAMFGAAALGERLRWVGLLFGTGCLGLLFGLHWALMWFVQIIVILALSAYRAHQTYRRQRLEWALQDIDREFARRRSDQEFEAGAATADQRSRAREGERHSPIGAELDQSRWAWFWRVVPGHRSRRLRDIRSPRHKEQETEREPLL